MTPDKDATWINVWFTEGAAKVMLDSEYTLSRCIDNTYEESVVLECIDGTMINVRPSYIQGYYINTPELRANTAAWEKILEKQEKESKGENPWD